MEKEAIIKDWLEGRISAEEAQRRGAFPPEALETMRRLAETPRQWRVPKGKAKRAVWREMESRIDRQAELGASKGGLYRRTAYMAAAAALVLAAAVWALTQFGGGRFEASAAVAETKPLSLPDGSRAELNAASRIVYQRKGEGRSVVLEGEAFFQVEKKAEGQTFRVESGDYAVEVLGTAFNVRAYPGEPFSVHCREGKVKVYRKGQEDDARVLTAGQSVQADEASGELLSVKEKPAEKAALWKQKKADYRSAPLWRVLSEIERQYGVKAVNRTGEERGLYTGPMPFDDLGQSLEILRMAQSHNDYRFRLSGDTVYVEKGP